MSELEKWFEVFNKIQHEQRDNKIKRIKEWKKFGSPHSSIFHENGSITGFWNTTIGLIKIKSNLKKEFDPLYYEIISPRELDAINRANNYKQINLEGEVDEKLSSN